jgi:hypothetical protein
MPTDAFVQGGSGVIQLHQIPAAQGRAFWPYHEQVLAADLYEAEHPGVTVKRPWENEGQLTARVAKRQVAKAPELELNMDPSRAQPLLDRKRRELAGLLTEHPEYDRLFTALTKEINNLEGCLGRTPTRFKKGTVPKAEDEVSPELVEKLAKFGTLSIEKKRESIEKGKNIDLLALIQRNEKDPELQMMAALRITQLSAAKQEEAVTA